MSDVQTVQPDQGANPPVDPAANPQGADTAQTSEASNGAAEEKRKRRKLNADDVKLFHDIESLANQGESIPWSQLPIEIKRSVIPSSNRTKLIDKEIIDVKVNEDTGTIESILPGQFRCGKMWAIGNSGRQCAW